MQITQHARGPGPFPPLMQPGWLPVFLALFGCGFFPSFLLDSPWDPIKLCILSCTASPIYLFVSGCHFISVPVILVHGDLGFFFFGDKVSLHNPGDIPASASPTGCQ